MLKQLLLQHQINPFLSFTFTPYTMNAFVKFARQPLPNRFMLPAQELQLSYGSPTRCLSIFPIYEDKRVEVREIRVPLEGLADLIATLQEIQKSVSYVVTIVGTFSGRRELYDANTYATAQEAGKALQEIYLPIVHQSGYSVADSLEVRGIVGGITNPPRSMPFED